MDSEPNGQEWLNLELAQARNEVTILNLKVAHLENRLQGRRLVLYAVALVSAGFVGILAFAELIQRAAHWLPGG